MAQLHRQQSGLNRVEPAVVPFDFVEVLLRRPVVAEDPAASCDSLITGGDSAAFAACAEILARVEAEGCRVTHGSCGAPALLLLREVLRAVGLTGILNDQ